MKPWLTLALIFVAGLISGSALTVALRDLWLQPPGEKQMQRHWMHYLTSQLNLTADQQTKVDAVLAASCENMKAVHKDEVDRVSAIFQATHAQIFPLLTEDQRTKFAELEAKRKKDFAHHLHPGWPLPHDDPPPPPPPPGSP